MTSDNLAIGYRISVWEVVRELVLSGFTFKTVAAISPAAGYRDNNTGQLNEVGNSGRYWSSSPNSTNGYMLNFNNSSVNPDNNGNRDLGRSVRCVAAFITFLT